MDEMNGKEFEDKLRTERRLLNDIKEAGVSEKAAKIIDGRIEDINATLKDR